MSKTYAGSTIRRFGSRRKTIDRLSNELQKYGLDVLSTNGVSSKKVFVTDLNHNYGIPLFTIRAIKKLVKALQNGEVESKNVLAKLSKGGVRFIK